MRIGYTRLRTVVWTTLKENMRNPVLLVLGLFLPIYLIGVINFAAPDDSVRVMLPKGGGDTAVEIGLRNLYGIIMASSAVALIGGLTGMFVIQRAKQSDSRLVVVGYGPGELIGARFLFIGLMVAVVIGVTVGFLALFVVPELIAWFVLGLLVASLIYGMAGILVGVIFDKLAGTYIILFAPLLDILIFGYSSVVNTDVDVWFRVLPSYHPLQVMFDSAFTHQMDTLANLGWSLIYLVVLSGIAISVFYWVTRSG
ncbi:MAG: ABC transporter permease [Halobacteria archaeon]|nr:ABC transporter permease [Halobacteria archaeon]